MPVSRSGKPYCTDEQIKTAHAASALEYARAAGYPLKAEGSYYVHRDHDSMVFGRDGRWSWNSQNLHGDAIDMLVQFEGRGFVEAVLLLAGESAHEQIPQPRRFEARPEEKESLKSEFQLPQRNNRHSRAFAYLTKTRGIDRELVSSLLKEGKLYEDARHHNVVMVMEDAEGIPRGAMMRSTRTANMAQVRGLEVNEPAMARAQELIGQVEERTGLVFGPRTSRLLVNHAGYTGDLTATQGWIDRVLKEGSRQGVNLSATAEQGAEIRRTIAATPAGAAVIAHRRLDRLQVENGLVVSDNTRKLVADYAAHTRDTGKVETLLEEIREKGVKTTVEVLSVAPETEKRIRQELVPKAFKGMAKGSDRKESFFVFGEGNAGSLCVFEAGIDAMSYVTLRRRAGVDILRDHYFLTTGGSGDSNVFAFLKAHPEIREVVLCQDNDPAGQRFVEELKEKLEKEGYRVLRDQPESKDFNQDLTDELEAEQEIRRQLREEAEQQDMEAVMLE